MKNYSLNLYGLKELYERNTFMKYNVESRMYFESEFRNEDDNFVIARNIVKPKKGSTIKKNKKAVHKDESIIIGKNADAFIYFKNEYRQNGLEEDFYGNIIVPKTYIKK